MNLSGTVLPVVDLHMKFCLPPIEYNKFTVIVIAMVGDKTVGLLSDVLRYPPRKSTRSWTGRTEMGRAVNCFEANKPSFFREMRTCSRPELGSEARAAASL